MWLIELTCLALIIAGTLLRARAPNFREWVRDAPVVLVAAWIGEDSTIRLYDFYAYSPKWHGFLDVTPVLIPVIWVFVVLSARDIARALAPKHTVLLAYFLIFFDASLIEPICTFSGLWTWHEPGPFNVPYIGTLGWTFFGGSLVFCLEKLKPRWLGILVAPLMMHAFLTSTWWAALKWIGGAMPDTRIYVALMWLAVIALTTALVRSKRTALIDLALVLPRLGPAAFFFTLLYAYSGPLPLWIYSVSFALPWIAATRWALNPRAAPGTASHPS